jgi:MFS family permease
VTAPSTSTPAPTDRSRWWIPPAAIAIHLCVGSVYAWSVFNVPIERAQPAFPRGAAAYTFSIAIACLGLSAAVGGRWLERRGPRAAASVAAVLFGGGMLLGGLGVARGWLALLYLGYGVIGGMGLGLAYVSPVSALVKWFPDRRGMATGLAVLGFGGGSLVAAPLMNAMISARGVPQTLAILGSCYGLIMLVAARMLRVPPTGWRPAGWTPPRRQTSTVTFGDLPVGAAIRTPQFWLLWVMLFVNITAGISILAQGSPMMQDLFGRTPAQAAAFLGVIAVCNALGRLGWASLSDWIGRRTVFLLFFAAQMALFAAIPAIARAGAWPLFQVATLLIFSMYGGGFATIPAFLADLFGARNVGAVHGAILTAWSAAGVVGPLVITRVRNARLASLPAGADRLVLYESTLWIMVVLLGVGLIAAMMIGRGNTRQTAT